MPTPPDEPGTPGRPEPPRQPPHVARHHLVVVPLVGAMVAAGIGVVLLAGPGGGVSGWPFLLGGAALAAYALTIGRRQAR